MSVQKGNEEKVTKFRKQPLHFLGCLNELRFLLGYVGFELEFLVCRENEFDWLSDILFFLGPPDLDAWSHRRKDVFSSVGLLL